MADAVSSIVLATSPRLYEVRLTNISDGTGESLVTKVDISTLLLANGLAPTTTSIVEIQWSIYGFTSVRLYWDHTTDDLIDVLGSGNGYRSYDKQFLKDPGSAGGTGDILLTTAGAFSGATYDILLTIIPS